MAAAGLAYLNSPAAAVDPASLGTVLSALGELRDGLTAARATFLRRFEAANGHDADGYGSSSAWLAARARMTRRDARAAVRQMRQLTQRPALHDALAAGDISASWADEITRWTRPLPAEMRAKTDEILVAAATAGASLDDLAVIAGAAIEQWRSARPDSDDQPDHGDRSLRLGLTFGGAGLLRGDLTPECAAALTAVLESLGKKHGQEDDRDQGQRYHDALAEACHLRLRSRTLPARAGADTQVTVHVPLAQLRRLPGAPELEDAWLTARLGEPADPGTARLTGTDAVVAACDARTVPVVTGHADLTVIDKIIALARAAGPPGPGPGPGHRPPATGPDPHSSLGVGPSLGAGPHPAASGPSLAAGPAPGRLSPGRPASGRLSPRALQAQRYAIARLAIDFVSGPGGLASALRTGLLGPPYRSPSLPLDIGVASSIPAHIRRAVTLRDQHCAWPGCDRPPAACDVHHIIHQHHGGETSVRNCALLCEFHHETCVHRWGWRLLLNPDGSTEARSPDGSRVLHSHAPPRRAA
jgi:hypothetical protein